MYAIKFKRRDDKRWVFMQPDGKATDRRVFAARYPEFNTAKSAVDEMKRDERNNAMQFNVVALAPEAQLRPFAKDDRVVLARVRHEACRGKSGRVEQVVRSRCVIKVRCDDGELYEAAPENLDLAP